MLQKIIEYDSDKRSLNGVDNYGRGFDAKTTKDICIVLDDILSKSIASDEVGICKEIGEWLRFRVLFRLIPGECIYSNPVEDKPLIRKHLDSLGLNYDERLVSAVKCICTNYRKAISGSVRKFGITDVFIKYKEKYNRIMVEQNNRCFYCGIEIVYGENVELDHVLPWYLGGDPPNGSNWRFLCGCCNKGKNVYPYYSLSSNVYNWITPTKKDELTLGVRFAVLCRDRGCTISNKKPSEAELQVVKIIESGCWVFDNLKTVCK